MSHDPCRPTSSQVAGRVSRWGVSVTHLTLPRKSLRDTSVPISLRGRKTKQLLHSGPPGARPQEQGLCTAWGGVWVWGLQQKCTQLFLAPTPLFSCGSKACKPGRRSWRGCPRVSSALEEGLPGWLVSRVLTTVQREAFSSPLRPATPGGRLKLLCPTTLGLGICCFFSPSDHAQILDLKGTPHPLPRKLNFLEPGCPSAWCLENRPPRPRTLAGELGHVSQEVPFFSCSALQCGPGQSRPPSLKTEEGFPVLASGSLPCASCPECPPAGAGEGSQGSHASSRAIHSG